MFLGVDLQLLQQQQFVLDLYGFAANFGFDRGERQVHRLCSGLHPSDLANLLLHLDSNRAMLVHSAPSVQVQRRWMLANRRERL